MRCYFNDFVRLSFSSHPIVEKERILRINLFLSWSIFEALHQGDSSSSLSHLIDVYAVLVCHSTGGGWHLLPLHEDRGTSCLPSKALGKSQTFQVGKTTHGFWSGSGRVRCSWLAPIFTFLWIRFQYRIPDPELDPKQKSFQNIFLLKVLMK